MKQPSFESALTGGAIVGALGVIAGIKITNCKFEQSASLRVENVQGQTTNQTHEVLNPSQPQVSGLVITDQSQITAGNDGVEINRTVNGKYLQIISKDGAVWITVKPADTSSKVHCHTNHENLSMRIAVDGFENNTMNFSYGHGNPPKVYLNRQEIRCED